MRKYLVILLLFFFITPLFSYEDEEPSPTETQTIYLNKQYSKHEEAQISIIYYPYVDEIRVIYFIPKLKFNQAEAVDVCKEVLWDFMKSHEYYHYFWLRQPDQSIYTWREKDNRRVPYVKYIVFAKMTS